MSQLLIQLQNTSKIFGPKRLFEGLSLSVSRGERFALIGENGAGKTTILRILAGLERVDAGRVQRGPSITVGYLSQEPFVDGSGQSVGSYLQSDLRQIEQEMESLQNDLSDPSALAKWADLQEEYERRGGYRAIPLEEILRGLHIAIDLDRPLETLSSGERRRVDLAKALLGDPDLLLLDEPTNHLDEKSIRWLMGYLAQREGAAIIVSHDRRFINAVSNRLLELCDGALHWYGGNYDFYLEERERNLARQIKAYEEAQEEIARLKRDIAAMTFAKRKPSPPKDSNTMAYERHGELHQRSVQHRLNDMKDRLEKLELEALPPPRPKSIKGIVFAESLPSPIAIEWENVTKSFDGKCVLANVSNRIGRQEHVVLEGPNGAGKTTLLRCLLGETLPDAGEIRIAPQGRIGYLDQEGDRFPLDQTPLEYFANAFHLTETDVRSELFKAGLSGQELLSTPFGSMSAGQRKRLMILSLILTRPNILVLDEPTNHLDLTTLEALEKALQQFPGAILAVSHDTTFIEKIAHRKIFLK